MNFLRGGVINLQGANVNDIVIGEINNNVITGNENSTSTGFVLYLKESPKDSKISSNIVIFHRELLKKQGHRVTDMHLAQSLQIQSKHVKVLLL